MNKLIFKVTCILLSLILFVYVRVLGSFPQIVGMKNIPVNFLILVVIFIFVITTWSMSGVGGKFNKALCVISTLSLFAVFCIITFAPTIAAQQQIPVPFNQVIESNTVAKYVDLQIHRSNTDTHSNIARHLAMADSLLEFTFYRNGFYIRSTANEIRHIRKTSKAFSKKERLKTLIKFTTDNNGDILD